MPLFNPNFLRVHQAQFNLNSIPGIREKKEVIRMWQSDIESGKLLLQNEEEVKTRFISDFFGVVLGFNYTNSHSWYLRIELKTEVDATKPDASLGYFRIDDGQVITNDVRVVIEVKSPGTDLDKKQTSYVHKYTPVEQAFSYASKMGGRCKWVVVSNFIETRFYSASDQGKFECFELKDLLEENEFKKFVFLFHLDRFIQPSESYLDRLFSSNYQFNSLPEAEPSHILDQINDSLKRFDSSGHIDPKIVCNLKPFNILNNHVWHYERHHLFTINSEIAQMLKGVTIGDGKVSVSKALKREFEKKDVIDWEEKLRYFFERLNHCGIHEITAVIDFENIKTNASWRRSTDVPDEHKVYLDINILRGTICDCIECNYRSLQFNKIIDKLAVINHEEAEVNNEYAYAHTLLATDNFRRAYGLFKKIRSKTKGVEGKEIEYFIASYNLKHLLGLISGSDEINKDEIRKEIEGIDLDSIIWDELGHSLSPDVKVFLMDFKAKKILNRVRKNVFEILEEIEKQKKFIDGGGRYYFGGEGYISELHDEFSQAYLCVTRNFLLDEFYSDYSIIVEKVIQCQVLSFLTKDLRSSLESFHEFYLVEAITHLSPKKLRETFEEVTEITISEQSSLLLLTKFESFFKSFCKESSGYRLDNKRMKVHLTSASFSNKVSQIFTNIFILLQKIKIDESEFKERCVVPILEFILREHETLNWNHLEEFGKFLEKNASLFSQHNLLELLTLMIERDAAYNIKYRKAINGLCNGIARAYPEFKLSDKGLILKMISTCYGKNGSMHELQKLIYLWAICDQDRKEQIKEFFIETFAEKFNSELYHNLLRNRILKYDEGDYFNQYIFNLRLNNYLSVDDPESSKRHWDYSLNNFIHTIYILDIPMDFEGLSPLKNLPAYESWFLNPLDFNYDNFKARWLKLVSPVHVYPKLKRIPLLKQKVSESLKADFDAEIAEVYFKHFSD